MFYKKINQYSKEKNFTEINLNLGCGGRTLDGWINIDNFDYEKNDSSRSGSNYDLKMDIRELDCDDHTVHNILLVHVIEHFVRWESIKMFQHYYSKLITGGSLILEMPDLDKCIEWYLKGKNAPHIQTPNGIMNMGLTQFYGNQWDELDYETHRYVWRLDEVCIELNRIGFSIDHASWDAKFHQKNRDMFIIAKK